MKRVIVLGAGMVGRAMAMDLAKKNLVTAADIDEKALKMLANKQNISTQLLNVENTGALSVAIAEFDLVVSAVPGFAGMQTVMTAIKNKKDLVDISFMPEDVLSLQDLALENGVTAIADCGVAPGMPNIIAGFYNKKMQIDEFEYMVGGLPKIRNYPFEYKAPFSPCDVIEEYIRPARYVENGKLVVKPAMSDQELVNFEQVGTLEAFNTDGLRSLITTLKNIPYMKEKTLRFPGHISMIKALKEAGFFSKEPLRLKTGEMVPFELTSEVLKKAWKLEPDEHEFTIMRIKIRGKEKEEKKEIVYDLFDEFDSATQTSSMARTTGFTATAACQMILDKVFVKKGLFVPETIGENPVCFDYIMNYLRERKVVYLKKEILL